MTTVAFWSFLAWEKGQSNPLRWMEVGVMADLSIFSISSQKQVRENPSGGLSEISCARCSVQLWIRPAVCSLSSSLSWPSVAPKFAAWEPEGAQSCPCLCHSSARAGQAGESALDGCCLVILGDQKINHFLPCLIHSVRQRTVMGMSSHSCPVLMFLSCSGALDNEFNFSPFLKIFSSWLLLINN